VLVAAPRCLKVKRKKLERNKPLPVVAAAFLSKTTKTKAIVGPFLTKSDPNEMKKVFFFLSLFVFLTTFLWFVRASRPSSLPVSLNFVINQGDSVSLIAQRLYQNKIIRNPTAFIFSTLLSGNQRKIQAGSFSLSSSQTHQQILQKLTTGGGYNYWLTIKPGQRVEEIAESLPDNSSFTADQFLQQVFSKEGQFFPDSYLIPLHYSLQQTLDLLASHFQEKHEQSQQESTNNLSSLQSFILASLLEREAKTLADKKIIAGILINRLSLNMPLQVDATVQYARDSLYKPTKYWTPPQKTDLLVDSPFNTYLNPGLPPSPICNFGSESLQAALRPQTSSHLYYISDPSGKLHFASTLEEHNQNISTYLKN